MERLLPFVLFVFIILGLVLVWRRVDPRHDFLLDLTRRLSESETEVGLQETLKDGSRPSAGGHNGARGPHV